MFKNAELTDKAGRAFVPCRSSQFSSFLLLAPVATLSPCVKSPATLPSFSRRACVCGRKAPPMHFNAFSGVYVRVFSLFPFLLLSLSLSLSPSSVSLLLFDTHTEEREARALSLVRRPHLSTSTSFLLTTTTTTLKKKYSSRRRRRKVTHTLAKQAPAARRRRRSPGRNLFLTHFQGPAQYIYFDREKIPPCLPLFRVWAARERESERERTTGGVVVSVCAARTDTPRHGGRRGTQTPTCLEDVRIMIIS